MLEQMILKGVYPDFKMYGWDYEIEKVDVIWDSPTNMECSLKCFAFNKRLLMC